MMGEKKIETYIDALNEKLGDKGLSYDEKIQLIDNECNRYIDKIISKFCKSKSPQELEDIKNQISDYRKNLGLNTGITEPIIGICRQILAFGAAGFALSLGFLDSLDDFNITPKKYIAIAGIYYLQLMVVSIYILILYISQARFRYPFLQFEKIGNSWPFFYYATISNKVPYGVFQSKKSSLLANILYARDLLRYVGNATSDNTIARIKKELLQHFLLISLQAYLHQQSLKLANSFIYGFAGATIALIIILTITSLKII